MPNRIPASSCSRRLLAGALLLAAFVAVPSRADDTVVKIGSATVRIAEPVVVAESGAGEDRWGFHQFPTISRLPDGRLLVTWNATDDADSKYGHPGPSRVSVDGGRTWTEWMPDDPLLTVSHSPISPVGDGEFLCVPMSPALSTAREKIVLPEPAAKFFVYGEVLQYRLADLPPEVRRFVGRIPALRWKPATKRWERETVAWETDEALVRLRKGESVFSRPYLDNRLVGVGKRLLYPSYHLSYRLPDGTLPKNKECWCMASDDKGRTWGRLGLIAHDAKGESIRAEPSLVECADGSLACLIRCTDHLQRPLLIAHSQDGGRTWGPTRELAPFGVMPQTLRLAGGAIVASFGRPGVHLALAEDASARTWSERIPLIPAEGRPVTKLSCGYTRLLPLDDKSFLVAYSEFQRPRPDGKTGKAILVRKVTVGR